MFAGNRVVAVMPDFGEFPVGLGSCEWISCWDRISFRLLGFDRFVAGEEIQIFTWHDDDQVGVDYFLNGIPLIAGRNIQPVSDGVLKR